MQLVEILKLDTDQLETWIRQQPQMMQFIIRERLKMAAHITGKIRADNTMNEQEKMIAFAEVLQWDIDGIIDVR